MERLRIKLLGIMVVAMLGFAYAKTALKGPAKTLTAAVTEPKAESKNIADLFSDLDKQKADLDKDGQRLLKDLSALNTFVEKNPDTSIVIPQKLLDSQHEREDIYKKVERIFENFNFKNSPLPPGWQEAHSAKLLEYFMFFTRYSKRSEASICMALYPHLKILLAADEKVEKLDEKSGLNKKKVKRTKIPFSGLMKNDEVYTQATICEDLGDIESGVRPPEDQ